MGQKANTLTLRQQQNSFNLTLFNKKLFISFFIFLKNLKSLFFQKDVLVLDNTLNIVNNQVFFNLKLFYKSKKLTKYKKTRKKNLRKNFIRKIIFGESYSDKVLFEDFLRYISFPYRSSIQKAFFLIKPILKKNRFSKFKRTKSNISVILSKNFALQSGTLSIRKANAKYQNELKEKFWKRFIKSFSPLFLKSRSNLFIFSVTVLNKYTNRNLVTFFFKEVRQFRSSLFSRQFNLFIDFIKMTSLLVQNKIKTSQYIILICSIFKIISKKAHNKFLFFLRYTFNLIVSELRLFIQTKSVQSLILGIKFIIKGRLRAKPRASSYLIENGLIETQKINSNLFFASSQTYTLLGVFGFKIWIHRT